MPKKKSANTTKTVTKKKSFTKNLLFSNEVRRLCRFASSNFKGDPYNEIEKTVNFINK